MFSGGLKRKEQVFSAKAAGVSTTMLVLAVMGVFSPTIFQMVIFFLIKQNRFLEWWKCIVNHVLH
jgi:Ca2+/H+ antiporter